MPSGPFKDYQRDKVAQNVASGARPKLSTYGATAAAGLLAVLAAINPTYETIFGKADRPWLKFAVLAVIVVVWGAIMVADTLARRVPAEPMPAPEPPPADGLPADVQAELHQILREADERVRAADGLLPHP